MLFRKYNGGAIGSLVHVVALHGDEYACEFEVIADGYMLRFGLQASHLTCRLTDIT